MSTAMRFRFTPCALKLLVGALALMAGATRADGTASAATATKPELCIQSHEIRNTKVVDDHTVLFYINNNDIYKNVLPHKCSGLHIDDAILYKPTNDQLCSVDVITPLISSGGSFMRSASCGLGKFEPIDKATADALITEAKAARVSKN